MNQPSLERGADDQTFHDVIEAYCGALSYAPGETATVHVSTHAAAYDVVVERWGGERTIAWAANTSAVGDLMDAVLDSMRGRVG